MGEHGTHVASTVVGSFVANVNYGGLATGWAPRARLAVYKIIWGVGGISVEAVVLAAIDDAIYDGVDVLNLSIGGFEEAWLPTSMHAIKSGITMVYAAGNDGPYPQTLENSSLWVITVAASYVDRSFPITITLGDYRTLVVSESIPLPFLLLGRSFPLLAYSRDLQGQAMYLGGRECSPPSLWTLLFFWYGWVSRPIY